MIISTLNCKYKLETCNSNLYIYSKYAFDIKHLVIMVIMVSSTRWVKNTIFKILSLKYQVR